jgi:hypothetical protein
MYKALGSIPSTAKNKQIKNSFRKKENIGEYL